MQKNDIIEKIRALVYNILQDNKIELIDITYRRESAGNVLRISADTENGITVDECAKVNGLISEVLDLSNLMEDRYIIEVSSPGLDRPLKGKNDFLRVKGKKIRVRTYMILENKKEFIGKLDDVTDREISVLTDSGIKFSIPFDKISLARLDYEDML
ncbi:MAG: ribosome maturation factor RimP [Candidatus Omnitrophica bacterium]|nr:ribosome maturation factor RimP [Candidatus Omnitrophota bacterium]